MQYGNSATEKQKDRETEGQRNNYVALFLSSSVRRGFTLIELVTVIGIFSVISLLILGMHTQVSELQKRTSEEQKALSELRFALEVMSNNLRIGTVQYKKYNSNAGNGCSLATASPAGSKQNILHLVDEDGDQISYEYQAALGCPIRGTATGCIVKKYSGPASAPLSTPTIGQITAKTLRVKDFKVFILPLCDPYHPQCNPSLRRQPIISMVAGVDVPEKGGGYKTRYIQTTVSSRVYRHLPFICN